MQKHALKSLSLLAAFMILPNFANAADKLLQQSDFTYLGAFRVPSEDLGGPQWHGLSFGGSVIAYNPTNNSLFIVGHDWDQLVAEIKIPATLGNSSDSSNLPVATVLQNLSDITEGNILNLQADGSPIPANGTKYGGLIRYGNNLIGGIYAYYDGGVLATRSHFKSGLTLSAKGDFEGMYEVGGKVGTTAQGGFVGGYMTPVPANWQTVLGGKVLTGISCLSIISRSSLGSAAFAFDPDKLGTTPAPATALLYYPIGHPTIGTYGSSYTLYNMGTHQSGIVFPSGSKSIIYTGVQGLGEACYGPGSNILAEKGNRYNSPAPNNTCGGVIMTNTANPCCYDPLNSSKGSHAYPYADYVWAYDATDLARVKTGGKIVDNPSPNLVDGVSPTSTETYKPWHIKPYAYWEIKYPITDSSRGSVASGASAYDESTKTLYLVQTMADYNGSPWKMYPVVHAFKVNVAAPGPGALPPAAPTGLVVK